MNVTTGLASEVIPLSCIAISNLKTVGFNERSFLKFAKPCLCSLVFLDSNQNAKLGDFGLSKVVDHPEHEFAKTYVGYIYSIFASAALTSHSPLQNPVLHVAGTCGR
jgi:hypothetical protein